MDHFSCDVENRENKWGITYLESATISWTSQPLFFASLIGTLPLYTAICAAQYFLVFVIPLPFPFQHKIVKYHHYLYTGIYWNCRASHELLFFLRAQVMSFWKLASNIESRKPWINSLLGGHLCPLNCFMWISLRKTLIYCQQHKNSRMQLMKFVIMNLGCKVASCCTIWIKVKVITNSLPWPSWCFYFHSLLPSFYCWYHHSKSPRPGFDPGPGEVWSLFSLKLKQSLPAQINVSIADANTFPYRKLRPTDALV